MINYLLRLTIPYLACTIQHDHNGHQTGYGECCMNLGLVHYSYNQINDLLGMQNANLLNLPENYTFKYCKCSVAAVTDADIGRPLSRSDMARAIICRCGSKRTNSGLHIGQDVGRHSWTPLKR
jgi:hypothetical protein